MYQNLKTVLSDWHATTGERQKLQHAYLVGAVVITFLAGVISLVDADLGHTIVKIALIAVGTFLVNGIAWNLLHSSVLLKLENKPKSSTTNTQRKK